MFWKGCGFSLVLLMFLLFGYRGVLCLVLQKVLFGYRGVATKSATKSAFRIQRKAFRIHIFQGRNNTNFIAFVDVWG